MEIPNPPIWLVQGSAVSILSSLLGLTIWFILTNRIVGSTTVRQMREDFQERIREQKEIAESWRSVVITLQEAEREHSAQVTKLIEVNQKIEESVRELLVAFKSGTHELPEKFVSKG